jgi:hypothetical protein
VKQYRFVTALLTQPPQEFNLLELCNGHLVLVPFIIGEYSTDSSIHLIPKHNSLFIKVYHKRLESYKGIRQGVPNECPPHHNIRSYRANDIGKGKTTPILRDGALPAYRTNYA